jgi:hypothetical protein
MWRRSDQKVKQRDQSPSVAPPLPSDPVWSYASAARQSLPDRLQRRIGPGNDSVDSAKRKPVDDLLATPRRVDKSAMAQAGQVRADSGLGLPNGLDKLAHGSVVRFEELQDVEPSRIAQDPKKARGGRPVCWNEEPGIHIWKARYHVPSSARCPKRGAES